MSRTYGWKTKELSLTTEPDHPLGKSDFQGPSFKGESSQEKGRKAAGFAALPYKTSNALCQKDRFAGKESSWSTRKVEKKKRGGGKDILLVSPRGTNYHERRWLVEKKAENSNLAPSSENSKWER